MVTAEKSGLRSLGFRVLPWWIHCACMVSMSETLIPKVPVRVTTQEKWVVMIFWTI